MATSKGFGVAACAVTGVLLLAGCGSGGGSTAVSSPSATSSASSGSPTGGLGARGFRRPGVSGVIASRTGSSATVNATNGSTSKVTWTSATPIVAEQPATAAAVKNGACVSIRMQGFARPGGATARPTGTSPSTRPSGTRHAGQFNLPGKLTATGVTIQPASDCSSTKATGLGGFGGFSGTVSNVSASGFSMTVELRQRAASDSSSGSSGASSTPKKIAVTTNSSTTYTQDVTGSASSVVAGECMTALGTTSGTTLAAKQITISQTVNGSCASGFGGFGSRGGNAGGASGGANA